jgi:hypothetical protein
MRRHIIKAFRDGATCRLRRVILPSFQLRSKKGSRDISPRLSCSAISHIHHDLAETHLFPSDHNQAYCCDYGSGPLRYSIIVVGSEYSSIPRVIYSENSLIAL